MSLSAFDYKEFCDYDDILNACHENFKKLVAPITRPKLFGKKVSYSLEWIDKKAHSFLHASSLSLDEVSSRKNIINILPCNNDISASLCPRNCINKIHKVELNSQTRYICYYRAARTHWISEIIEFANNSDPNVLVWEKVDPDSNKLKTYLRYICDGIDYLIVFVNTKNTYIFITSFPVFFISSKDELDKDYQTYIQNKSR